MKSIKRITILPIGFRFICCSLLCWWTMLLIIKVYFCFLQWTKCSCCWCKPHISCVKKRGKDHPVIRCKIRTACKWYLSCKLSWLCLKWLISWLTINIELTKFTGIFTLMTFWNFLMNLNQKKCYIYFKNGPSTIVILSECRQVL